MTHGSKSWIWALSHFHRADTFRKLLPTLLLLALVTALTAWFELGCLCLAQSHPLKNITLMHSLLGFAISMLLVFRTNTAYDRWWEGRKLWASMVCSCHSLTMKLRAFTASQDEASREWMTRRLNSFLQEAKSHLSAAPIERDCSHPLEILSEMHQQLHQLCQTGKLPESRLFLLVQELTNLGSAWVGCQRIRDTPIPLSYLLFIKKFIAAYTLTLPLGFAFSLGWYAVPVVVFIFYVLASLELIAEQIEEPFGQDAPDLGLDAICLQASQDLQRILSAPDLVPNALDQGLAEGC